ncbi:MAG: nucleotide exchange factor GrpE [Ignavibacteria bacterium]|jgi:molecular chaperone GrpE
MSTDNNEELQESEETAHAESHDLSSEAAEWKELAIRRLAEVENIRRRTNLEKQELLLNAAQHTITKMLPILDDLHAAIEASRTTKDADALVQGIGMIYAKTVKIFEESGVHVIEAEPGELFDVDKHEALMHTPSDHPEGSVIQSVQRGYVLHDKVLRHAKVITSAGNGTAKE